MFTHPTTSMRLKAKKDLNHDELVGTFGQLGCPVIDLTREGRGIPDLLVLCLGKVHLVEIKNPQTHYGRKGLSLTQQRVHEAFAGCIAVVRTSEDVYQLVLKWRSEETSDRVAGLAKADGR